MNLIAELEEAANKGVACPELVRKAALTLREARLWLSGSPLCERTMTLPELLVTIGEPHLQSHSE